MLFVINIDLLATFLYKQIVKVLSSLRALIQQIFGLMYCVY